MPKLTKRLIDAVALKPTDVFVWDDDLPGFGLRVKPTGVRSFVAQYRNRGGRSRRYTIGRYGVLTLAEAREAGRLLLAQVARGEDPADVRVAERAAMTVADLCKEYLDRSEQGLVLTRRKLPKKATTLYTDTGRVLRHVVPLLGHRTVKDLTPADLRAFVRDVTRGKTKVDVATKARGRAIVTGGKGTATRTMALVSSILTYGVGEGYRADNPAKGLVLPAYERRDQRLDDDQYRILGAALRQAEQAGETWQAVLAIRFLALTGCRRGEVTKLLAAEVDLPAQMLALVDTKTGASRRPLGLAAVAVLEQAQERSQGRYVFPAARGAEAGFGGLPKAWERIVGAVLPGVTPHTLRHSLASVANDAGYTEATIGAMIGHAGSGTTRRYIHRLDPVLIAAADTVAGRINEMMS